MKDVADVLGVSKATVSRAFRNHPKCGPELRSRILSKARELGYAPDPLQRVHMAQVRARPPEGMVGAVVWMLDLHPRESRLETCMSNGRLVRGARERAEALGLKFEVFRPDDHGLTAAGLERVLTARGIHGLIVAPLGMARRRIELKLEKVAAVSISYTLEAPVMHRISHDHYQMMWDVMTYLRSRGCTRAGLAVQPEFLRRMGRRWHAAYMEFCEEYKELSTCPVLFLNQGVLDDGAEEAQGDEVRAWVVKHKLDAVLSLSPWIASALAKAPATKDVAFVDLDWYPGKCAWRGARVDQDFELLGATAVDEVVAQWSRQEYGIPSRPKAILLHGKLLAPDGAGVTTAV